MERLRDERKARAPSPSRVATVGFALTPCGGDRRRRRGQVDARTSGAPNTNATRRVPDFCATRLSSHARERIGDRCRSPTWGVSELRLENASTIAEANAVLETYRPAHNKRFALPAKDSIQAWRPSPGSDATDSLCALQYVRLVANNNTVRVGGQIIDIPHKPRGRSYAKAYVIVRHLLDGRYRIYLGGELLVEAPGKPPTDSTYEPRTI